MSKALLIQSYTTLNTGTQGEWNELNMANPYIQGIQTGDILGNVNAQTLSALISGVPSPWARANYSSMLLIQSTILIPILIMEDYSISMRYFMVNGVGC